jgi:hypothetical protein
MWVSIRPRGDDGGAGDHNLDDDGDVDGDPNPNPNLNLNPDPTPNPVPTPNPDPSPSPTISTDFRTNPGLWIEQVVLPNTIAFGPSGASLTMAGHPLLGPTDLTGPAHAVQIATTQSLGYGTSSGDSLEAALNEHIDA